MKEAGAKRALLLPVGGAFHSMMEPARGRASSIEAQLSLLPFAQYIKM
jgi:hypothetical protein